MVIIILRDPLERAYSAWNFYKKFKRYSHLPSFEECINHEMKVINQKIPEDWLSGLRILRRGLYKEQIEWCFSIFNRNQVLIISSGNLRSKPENTLNSILNFLSLENYSWSLPRFKDRNVGAYREPMAAEIKQKLSDYYSQQNAGLGDLVGHSIQY